MTQYMHPLGSICLLSLYFWPPTSPQLLYDGADPQAVALLSSIRHVSLLHIHAPFAGPAERERFAWYADGAAEPSTRQAGHLPGCCVPGCIRDWRICSLIVHNNSYNCRKSDVSVRTQGCLRHPQVQRGQRILQRCPTLPHSAAPGPALSQWVGQPGNFGLMVKQGYGLLEALGRARKDGQHWLLHLDPDELFHPG